MIIQLPPPPPPPCSIVCEYKYQVFMPMIVKAPDIVCDSHNYCDYLLKDNQGYYYVTDDGIYNSLYQSDLVTINGKVYIHIESDSGSELPITNLGYVLIYYRDPVDNTYYYSTFAIVEIGL